MSDSSDTIVVAQTDSSERQDKWAQGFEDNSSINDLARSHAPGWTPPCPITREDVALKSLKVVNHCSFHQAVQLTKIERMEQILYQYSSMGWLPLRTSSHGRGPP